jgi:hypothetical protein
MDVILGLEICCNEIGDITSLNLSARRHALFSLSTEVEILCLKMNQFPGSSSRTRIVLPHKRGNEM